MSDSQQPSDPQTAAPGGSTQPGQQPPAPQPGYPAQQAPGHGAYQPGPASAGVPPQPYGVPPQQTYPGYAPAPAPGHPAAHAYGQPPAPGYPPAQGYGVPQPGYPSAPGYPPVQGYAQPPAGRAPQPGYPAAQQAAPTTDGAPTNTPALWSLILGAISAASLLSLLIPFFGFFIVIMAFPLSICSVALGYAGLAKAKRTGGVGRTNAIIGMILGHIVLLVAIAVGIFLLMALVAAMSSGSFG